MSEKRYFRLYARLQDRKQGENKYLLLFDKLLEQETYNPNALLNSPENSFFHKNYSATKNYLHRLILKSMRAFQAEQNVKRQLKGLMLDGIFLYEKTLYQQAERVFRKARKLAKKHEDLLTLLELVVWERRLLKRLDPKDRAGQLDRLLAEQSTYFHQIEQINRYYDRFERLLLFQRKQFSWTNDTQSRQLELWAKAKSQDPPETFHAERFFLQAQCLIARLSRDFDSALNWFLKHLELWESHPHMMLEDPVHYRVQLANLIHLHSVRGEYTKIPPLLKKVSDLPVTSGVDKLFNEQVLHLYEFLVPFNQGQFLKAQNRMAPTQKWLRENKSGLRKGTSLIFNFNFLLLHFLLENWSEARQGVSRVLQETISQDRQDLQIMARIIQLILMIELEMEDLVEPRYRSLQRTFGKKSPPEAVGLVVEGIRKIAAHALTDRRKIADQLLKTLEKLPSSAWPGLHEVGYWLWALAKNISLREHAQTQLRQKN